MKKQAPAPTLPTPPAPGAAMKRLLSEKELLAVSGGGNRANLHPSVPSPGNH